MREAIVTLTRLIMAGIIGALTAAAMSAIAAENYSDKNYSERIPTRAGPFGRHCWIQWLPTPANANLLNPMRGTYSTGACSYTCRRFRPATEVRSGWCGRSFAIGETKVERR